MAASQRPLRHRSHERPGPALTKIKWLGHAGSLRAAPAGIVRLSERTPARTAPMSIETLKTEIAREFGTPAVVVDLDRSSAISSAGRSTATRSGSSTARTSRRTGARDRPPSVRARRRRHHVPEARRGGGDGRRRHPRHVADLQHPRPFEARPAGGPHPRHRLSRSSPISEIVVAGLEQAAEAGGRKLGVLIECDTGAGRNGVQSPAAAQISGASHLGISATHLRRSDDLSEVRRTARHRGLLRRGARHSLRPTASKSRHSRAAARPTCGKRRGTGSYHRVPRRHLHLQ